MDCRNRPPFELRVGPTEHFKEGAVCKYIPVIPVHNGHHFIKTFDQPLVLPKPILGGFSSREIRHRARYANDFSNLIKCGLVRRKEGSPAMPVRSWLTNLQVKIPFPFKAPLTWASISG